MRKLFKVFLVVIVLVVLVLGLDYFYGYSRFFRTYQKINGVLLDFENDFDKARCEKLSQEFGGSPAEVSDGRRSDVIKVSEAIDDCYYRMAIMYLDDNLCEKMSVDKAFCIEKISLYKDFDACLSFVGGIKFEGQRDSEERACYVNYAFYMDDPGLCEEAKDSDSCYYILASKKNVYSGICDKIDDAKRRNNCYFIGALRNDNQGLCSKMTYLVELDESTFPYDQIALKDICFYYFAHDKGNPSFCDKIVWGRFRRNCKLSFYL